MQANSPLNPLAKLNQDLKKERDQYYLNRKRLEEKQETLKKIAGSSEQLRHIGSRVAKFWPNPHTDHFRPQFVEPFLQQATGLVDRVLSEDPPYRQLLVDQLNLRLDLEELVRLQQINDDEVDNGLFNVPYWEAQAAVEADLKLRQAQDEFKDFLLDDDNKVPDVANNLAERQLSVQMAPVEARVAYYQKRATYMELDKGYRERRKMSSYQKLIDKLSAVPNGPLNYEDRLSVIEERAGIDLSEAYARLTAVRAGLKLVYGMETPDLPSFPSASPPADDLPLMTQLVRWLRTVGFDLQRIYDNDQECVVSFAVSELLKDEHFSQGAKRGSWEFAVAPGHFGPLKLVRLRGLSATAEASGKTYRLVVSAPKDCSVLYGPADSVTSGRFDVDDCWLGNVTSARINVRPDVFGTRILWNACPFGRWTIRAAPGVSTGDLKDIRLNFHAVVQRQS